MNTRWPRVHPFRHFHRKPLPLSSLTVPFTS